VPIIKIFIIAKLGNLPPAKYDPLKKCLILLAYVYDPAAFSRFPTPFTFMRFMKHEAFIIRYFLSVEFGSGGSQLKFRLAGLIMSLGFWMQKGGIHESW
jgi:hypothetical protein